MPDAPPAVRIAAVELSAPREDRQALAGFYGSTLGLDRAGDDAFSVGGARLALRAGEPSRRPFHHLALLVPGDRFEAARAWASERTSLLDGPGGTPHVRFEAWDADALYFLDPAGSIVELIAHRGVAEAGTTGPFDPAELAGISEVGLVLADGPAAAAALEAQLALAVWSGDPAGGLAFAGRRAHTLILAAPGRPWLPTGRRAERHPVSVVVEGTGRSGSVELPGRCVVTAA